jgi:hypothetical protein
VPRGHRALAGLRVPCRPVVTGEACGTRREGEGPAGQGEDGGERTPYIVNSVRHTTLCSGANVMH